MTRFQFLFTKFHGLSLTIYHYVHHEKVKDETPCVWLQILT